jgi:RTX calcium-binding nonapeptide repeat (4 copies)
LPQQIPPQQFVGTSANDRYTGGRGNDTFLYNAAPNAGSHDVFDGGSGDDTLVLQLTRAQPQTGVAGSNGYGTFTIGSNGVWSYATTSARHSPCVTEGF